MKTRNAVAALMVATSAARLEVSELVPIIARDETRKGRRAGPRFYKYLGLAFLSDPHWPGVHFALDLRGGELFVTDDPLRF